MPVTRAKAMLEYSHDPMFVAGSFMVSLLAAFTGLSLTRGLSALPVFSRKVRVAMAAVALGTGIWSMHFIGMLGLQLPVQVFYDPVTTLLSAMVAILITGLSLLILHFRRRDGRTIVLAGALMGLGVAAMHYLGMSGMAVCRPVYSVFGVVIPVLAATALGILAISIAYGARTRRNTLLGTAVFGAAVVAVHYLAMASTGLVLIDVTQEPPLALTNTALALLVAFAAFGICGSFLLSSATFFAGLQDQTDPPMQDPAGEAPAPTPPLLVPFERHGRTEFIPPQSIAAIRAEGHYTILYAGEDKLFCPWSISKARTRLAQTRFLQAHRSYLVNPDLVTGFERRKDNGVVFFGTTPSLELVPVSRSRLGTLRDSLGL